MPSEDITLYAIYKKELKATYKLGTGIYKIGKENDSCFIYNNESSCTLTLPNIEVKEGYIVDGWYDEEENKKSVGDEIALTENVIYTAKAVDKASPTITLTPNSKNVYVKSQEVVLTIRDEDSGLKANQEVYYGWSISNEDEPTSWNYVTTENEEGAKEATVTISSLSKVTGIYYLWIKEGTLSDVNGNLNKEVISGEFKFDNTLPMLNVTTSKTTRSITVVADAEDDSGISKYEYSIDNGETWIDGGIKNTYTFTDLVYDTYEIKVKVTDGVGLTNETHLGISPNLIETPTFTEDTIGIVTINFPKECEEEYVCSYIKNDETEVTVKTMTQEVVFDSDGTLIAKITDGLNYITSSVYNVIVTIDTELAYEEDTYKEYNVIKDGYYKIELWGAQGGSQNGILGGNGSYTSGEIYLEEGEKLYFYIGENSNENPNGAYNGGGIGSSSTDTGGNAGIVGGSGGGATDVRLVSGEWNDTSSLRSRIMVAAGGGGASNYGLTAVGGNGGDLIGESGKTSKFHSGVTSAYTNPTGGKQTVGGSGGIGTNTGSAGAFGYATSEKLCGGGSGSGYYAGGTSTCADSVVSSGAGGSSYISGYAGVNSITSETSGTHTNQTKHYSEKYFINTEMQAGINTGNGKAAITFLGDSPSSEDSKKILGVRYIKDCTNGSTYDTSNQWVEVQAINKGINVAKGKSITSTSTMDSNTSGTISEVAVVDGIIEKQQFYQTVDDGLQCITVDLEKEYDLEEVAVWHYYFDRSANENVTSVAGENQNYRELNYYGSETETSNGKHIKTDSIKPEFHATYTEETTVVTITYPEGCGTDYTCTYQKNSEEIVETTESIVEIEFTSSGTLTAEISNSNGELSSETFKVQRNEVYVASYGSDTEGDGSKENPYATINKAYDNAYTTATIYIMDDINQTEIVNFDLEKEIILTSYSEDGDINSILRNSSFTDKMVMMDHGTLTLKNITLDGQNIESENCLYVTKKSELNIEEGATIQNFNVTKGNKFGPVFMTDTSILNLRGGSIKNNKATDHGGGVFTYHDTTFNMIGGEITGNETAVYSGGGAYLHGTFNMSGGTISNNIGKTHGGGLMCKSYCNITGGTITENTATTNTGGGIGNDGTIIISGDSVNITGNISSTELDKDLSNKGTIVDVRANHTADSTMYSLRTSLNNDYVLDVSGAAAANNTNLIIYNSNSGNNQKWKFYPRKDENGIVYYSIQSQIDGTQYAWVKGNDAASGANVITYEMNVNAGGYWSFSPYDDGYYEIKSILGTCLDVYGSTAANSTNVDAYTCNQTNAQKWKLSTDFTSVVTNSISMTSNKSSKSTYQSCTGSWEDYKYTFNISISGGSVSSGKLCYASSSSKATSYCKNYASSGSTGYGQACFNSATNWVFYRSSACAYAYATGSHGLSTSRFQC